jgi:hypothetical protein
MSLLNNEFEIHQFLCPFHHPKCYFFRVFDIKFTKVMTFFWFLNFLGCLMIINAFKSEIMRDIGYILLSITLIILYFFHVLFVLWIFICCWKAFQLDSRENLWYFCASSQANRMRILQGFAIFSSGNAWILKEAWSHGLLGSWQDFNQESIMIIHCRSLFYHQVPFKKSQNPERSV